MASSYAAILAQPDCEATHGGLYALGSAFHLHIEDGKVWIDIPYTYNEIMDDSGHDTSLVQNAFSFDDLEYPTFEHDKDHTVGSNPTIYYPVYPLLPSDGLTDQNYFAFDSNPHGNVDLCHVKLRKFKVKAVRLRERQGHREYLEWTKTMSMRWNPNPSEWESVIENFVCYLHNSMMFGLNMRVSGMQIVVQIIFLVSDKKLAPSDFDVVESMAHDLGGTVLRWFGLGYLNGLNHPRSKTIKVMAKGNSDVCAVLKSTPDKCVLFTP